MDPWPFSDDEWQAVRDAALGCVNATFAEDTVLRASHFAELAAVLADLRIRHGEHPVLLETLTDFTDDPAERVRLYREAVAQAGRWGTITYTIRLSLAGVLLQQGADDEARTELDACRNEVESEGDDSDRRTWADLRQACSDVAEEQ